MTLNLNHLRIFYFCGKCRTFSEAAKTLFLTQPAVTMQIKQLEADIGLDLFHHHVKTIHLTEPGRILFEHAQKIFELAESTDNIVKELKNLKIGVLRIGTLPAYARYLMPPLITSYREKYPGIHVALDEGSPTEITRSLIDYDNELGLILAKSPFSPKLELIPCLQDEFLLVLASCHPLNRKRIIRFTDLTNESLIVRHKSEFVSREFILDKYREAKIEPRALIEARSLALILGEVEAGKGIAFIAKQAVKNQFNFIKQRALACRSLSESPLLINIDIAYLKNRILSPAARAFIDLLMERKDVKISREEQVKNPRWRRPK